MYLKGYIQALQSSGDTMYLSITFDCRKLGVIHQMSQKSLDVWGAVEKHVTDILN